ncbi:MAG: secretion protein HlyD [Oscillospiraceae bacterium]|jgi:hypothetical protein|nr:secretion protein HlyD [Oscillospiraceae bacterium]
MNQPLIRRLATLAIACLLFLYVGYQIYQSHYSGTQTETASYFSASDSVQVSGIVVRDETLLKGGDSGVIDYILSAGDKIASGGTVAQIYSSAQQAAARHEIAVVDSEIKRLEALQMPGDTYTASPDVLDERIRRQICGMIGQTISGSFPSLTESREELQYLINERQIVTGEVTDFRARLTELQAKRGELVKQQGTALGKIVSPASGYFIPSTDGFETAIDFSSVRGLTCDQIQTALKAKSTAGESPGKISKNYEWYFAFNVSSDQAAEFRRLADGGTVTLQFPFASNMEVPASVAAVNQAGSDASAAIVLRCNYMNSELASIRKETAQVVIRQYTGIRVSRKALHFETVTKTVKDEKGKAQKVKKEVSGIYALNGNQVDFRQVVPLYSTDNYVICDPNPEKGTLMTDKTIQLHDEVVVEGTDLYDGKVVQ